MPASDFFLGDGFGNLSDGTHTAGVTREILGGQWASYTGDFGISDIGDGRKWMTVPAAADAVVCLQSGTFDDKTTLYVAFLLYPTDRDYGFNIRFRDGSSEMGCLYVTTGGTVAYYRTDTDPRYGGLVLESSIIPLDTPTHVEMKIVFDNAAGAVSIWLNGVLDASTSGVDTIYAGTACDNILMFCGWYALIQYGKLPAGWKFTDFILHEAADHIGVATVQCLLASADGTDTDFTPSAGVDHYAMVDEIGPDEDVTFDSSDGTAGHRDGYENAGISGLTVLTVQSLHRVKKTGTGAATILPGMLHAAVEDQGDAQAVASDYGTLVDFFDDCPSTGAAWTLAQVSAAEVTIEVG